MQQPLTPLLHLNGEWYFYGYVGAVLCTLINILIFFLLKVTLIRISCFDPLLFLKHLKTPCIESVRLSWSYNQRNITQSHFILLTRYEVLCVRGTPWPHPNYLWNNWRIQFHWLIKKTHINTCSSDITSGKCWMFEWLATISKQLILNRLIWSVLA